MAEEGAVLTPLPEEDLLAAVVAWALTWAIAEHALAERLRPAIPALAVLLAVGLRAGADALAGVPLGLDTLLHGVAAGAGAVLAHSQVREVAKALARAE